MRHLVLVSMLLFSIHRASEFGSMLRDSWRDSTHNLRSIDCHSNQIHTQHSHSNTNAGIHTNKFTCSHPTSNWCKRDNANTCESLKTCKEGEINKSKNWDCLHIRDLVLHTFPDSIGQHRNYVVLCLKLYKEIMPFDPTTFDFMCHVINKFENMAWVW